MLVLARKVGESVQIGDITVQVLEIHTGYIRVGIMAPKTVRILRTELLPAAPPFALPESESSVPLDPA
jgi:carbon storage regulator